MTHMYFHQTYQLSFPIHFQSSCRKSALLSAAKKAKLKSNPSRVRFAESIDISNGDGDGGGNGAGDAASSGSGKGHDSVQTLMPNVLKVSQVDIFSCSQIQGWPKRWVLYCRVSLQRPGHLT